MVKIPWEQTERYIRSGHRSPEDFQEGSLRTITLSGKEGIKAVVGKPKGSQSMEVQTYLFDESKGWTVEKAKAWFKRHRESKVKEHVQAVLPFQILEKIVDKPLRIKGVAMTAGISRNFNVYTSEELQVFADKLAGAPVYVEHVAVPNAVGKVVNAWWDPQGKAVWYEAEIYDDEVAEKIRKGLIHHVSVGADYETIDVLNGKVPHGLHNAELSLVAVPGIPETNIQILEKLQAKEQAFPLHAVALVKDFKVDGREFITPGEYILGFHRDPYAFLPEHFSTVWLDRQNGILALVGRLKTEPEKRRIQAVFFSKDKMWDEGKIRDWFLLHPHYLIERVEDSSAPTGENANMQTPLKEREKMNSQKQSEEEKQVEKQAQKGLVEKEEHKQTRLTERVWTRRYINNLPDSAFAVILPGGKKDNEGKTVPRSLRKFPHHDANGKIDLPHLRNANARLPQSDIPQEYKEKAMRHLAAHKKALGIGMASEEAKLLEQTGEGEAEGEFEASTEPTLDELIANTEDIMEQVDKAIESLKSRVEKVEAIVQKGKSEKSVAEQLLKPEQNPNLIDKNEILKLIPPERVVRSWSYGPRLLVNQLRYMLSKSSRDREVSQDELAETETK